MIKRFALGSAIIVLLTAASVATGALLELDSDLAPFTRDPLKVPPGVLPDVSPGEPQTILVLGSDRRYGDKRKGIPPRSDSMLVIRLDPKKNATAVMSIPRDLMVTIPRHGRGRINTAYGTGGPTLSARAVKGMGIEVNHILNVNFSGFQRAVNRLGCVYADVDRRYFNDNNPPVASNEKYATIDLKPGYQRMCGKDSLDYVRFRHLDDDFVRAARQQDFLRTLKSQVGVGQLWGDRRELLKIFGRYAQTTITRGGNAKTLGFIKLAVEAARNPVTEVRFPAGRERSDGSIGARQARQRQERRSQAAQARPAAHGRADGGARGRAARGRGPRAQHRHEDARPGRLLPQGAPVARRLREQQPAGVHRQGPQRHLP
jgi:LCP family protein required for cell wall assembly